MTAVMTKGVLKLDTLTFRDNPLMLAAFERVAGLMYRTQRILTGEEDRKQKIRAVFAMWIDGVPGMSPGDLVLYADGDVGADALYVVRKEDQYYIGNVQFKLDGGPVFLQRTLGGEPVRLGQLADTHIEGRVLGWMHVHR